MACVAPLVGWRNPHLGCNQFATVHRTVHPRVCRVCTHHSEAPFLDRVVSIGARQPAAAGHRSYPARGGVSSHLLICLLDLRPSSPRTRTRRRGSRHKPGCRRFRAARLTRGLMSGLHSFGRLSSRTQSDQTCLERVRFQLYALVWRRALRSAVDECPWGVTQVATRSRIIGWERCVLTGSVPCLCE